jgi:tetratricopeptide (TPR) repeat protein
MGELSQAKPYFERALAINEEVLGAKHPDTALSLNNLGGLLQAMGELSQAKPYYERALAIVKEKLGVEHATTKIMERNLAILLEELMHK